MSADGHPASGAFTFVVGSGVAPDASIVAGAAVGGGSDSAGVVLKVLRGLGYIGLTLSIGLWAFVLLVDRAGRGRSCPPRAGRGRVARSSPSRRWRASLPRRPTRGWAGTRSSSRTSEQHGSRWPVSAPCSPSRRSTGSVSRRARKASCSRRWRSAQGWPSPTAGTVRSVGRTGWDSPRRWCTWSPRPCGSAGSWASRGAGSSGRASDDGSWRRGSRTSRWSPPIVVVASGIVQSIRQLDTWSEVTGTDFGRTLIVKVALVLVARRARRGEPPVGVATRRTARSDGRCRGGRHGADPRGDRIPRRCLASGGRTGCGRRRRVAVARWRSNRVTESRSSA